MDKRDKIWQRTTRLSAEDVLLTKEVRAYDEVDLPDRQAAIEILSDCYSVPARSGAD